MLALALVVAALGLGAAVFYNAGIGQLIYLPPLPGERRRPRVSVVVAARDEADRIAGCVRHLLQQEGIELQLIVVDDRSRDGTSAIVQGLAAADARVALVRIDHLPEGWLGKVHALSRGAQAASGDWILFCDGDTWMKPDVIARAVAAGEAASVDHVCLTPHVAPSTSPLGLMGDAATVAFGLNIVKTLIYANQDRPGNAAGIGAFNLIRADTYRRIGGHEPLRMEIGDDVMLGRLVSLAGGRTRGYQAHRDVECVWATSPAGMVRALEKNMFAIVGFRLGVVVALLAALAVQLTIAASAPFVVGGVVGWAPLAGILSLGIPGWRLARRFDVRPLAGVLAPLGMLVCYAALVNSTWKTLSQGGVRWRDTFYPLADLRRGSLPLFRDGAPPPPPP